VTQETQRQRCTETTAKQCLWMVTNGSRNDLVKPATIGEQTCR